MMATGNGAEGDVHLRERYDFALGLMAEASALALGFAARLATLVVHSKGLQDMATEADLAVEQLIRSRIEQRYPRDSFLGEETGHAGFDPHSGIWVVDPIDGTQPFISGLPEWCISIAYVENGRVQFGLVGSPSRGELFAGGTWFAATLNGVPIEPHPGRSLAEGITYLGASPRVSPEQVVPVLDRLLRAGGMFVRGGSGALGLCNVACGRLLGYVEAHINSWDCLGAVAVLRAAGCTVNDFLQGDALFVGNKIVAGPPAVYEALSAVLG